MIRQQNDAAGGPPPAARISGPQWRERHDRPVYQATIWPNQSLTPRGYQLALAAAGIGLALPLLGLVGTGIFWMIAVFVIVPFLALRFAFRQNSRALRIEERLQIWRDEVRVERHEADGRILRWQCDPMRLRLHLHKNGKVEEYLTLAGGGREIELGAFLAPEERIALAEEIENGLNRALRS